MEENKTIGTATADELKDDDLEKAAGGCFPGCDMHSIMNFTCWNPAVGQNCYYMVQKCTKCGQEKYFRSERANLYREISSEEFMWAYKETNGVSYIPA